MLGRILKVADGRSRATVGGLRKPLGDSATEAWATKCSRAVTWWFVVGLYTVKPYAVLVTNL
ncbi:hypothetical protein EC9_27200 [Rosistilla ulvae]|uniref:Uncharacterized protein n=1 Tax=Rosistilla ulvae TaxID=1930277 RepID=A0A517M138_9BACT|nr:hypothetical protein EC9_27200 [Rosistilla ulvae]